MRKTLEAYSSPGPDSEMQKGIMWKEQTSDEIITRRKNCKRSANSLQKTPVALVSSSSGVYPKNHKCSAM